MGVLTLVSSATIGDRHARAVRAQEVPVTMKWSVARRNYKLQSDSTQSRRTTTAPFTTRWTGCVHSQQMPHYSTWNVSERPLTLHASCASWLLIYLQHVLIPC
jgi:hypothetical protein